MDISMGTLIGQLLVLGLVIFAFVVAIRFLLAATRLMNRKSRAPERQSDLKTSGRSDSVRAGERSR